MIETELIDIDLEITDITLNSSKDSRTLTEIVTNLLRIQQLKQKLLAELAN